MSLTRKETVDLLPLFIRRDLGALSEQIQGTRNLSRPQKIEVLGAIARMAVDPDDLAALGTCFKILGI